MDARQSISIAEIRELSLQVFDRISSAGLSEVALDNQFYWSVPPTKSFILDEEPQPVLGDLVDDIGDLRTEAGAMANDFHGWHAIEHLIGLLTAVSAADFARSLGNRDREPR